MRSLFRPSHLLKKDKFHGFANITTTTSLVMCLTCIAIPLSFYLLYNPKTPNSTIIYDHRNKIFVADSERRCNLFKGQWIRDRREPLYTNYSCTTMPFLKNCFLHGRRDRDFLHWRWRPDQCELPRFRPLKFLDSVRGKTMAFIGDSIARNHMESLVCLLSTVATPKLVQKDSEDHNLIWEFPTHNFTLMVIWSQFLVKATDRLVNGSVSGSFNLHLDKIDPTWSTKLPLMDYVIFSDAHWFFRNHNVYENDNLVGCIYCDSPNELKPGTALRRALRAALKQVNDCSNCKKLHVMVRTFSPAHFENGAWDKGGGCNRTWPIKRDEVDKDWSDWEYQKIQIKEIEDARREGVRRGHIFQVIDVTEMMLMRPDGHPGLHWGNRWMKGYSDCIHWCMPGPIDTWNELMLELIDRWTSSNMS